MTNYSGHTEDNGMYELTPKPLWKNFILTWLSQCNKARQMFHTQFYTFRTCHHTNFTSQVIMIHQNSLFSSVTKMLYFSREVIHLKEHTSHRSITIRNFMILHWMVAVLLLLQKFAQLPCWYC